MFSYEFCKRKVLWNISVWLPQSMEEMRTERDYCSTTRSSHRRCSIKKGVRENFVKLTGKHLCQNLLFHKVEALVQVFFCEFGEMFKNTFFNRTPPVAASVQSLVQAARYLNIE